MERYTLPGIVKIQMIRCEDIPPHVIYSSLSGAPVALALPATDIKFYGTPTLKWEGSIVNGARQEKSTLEFDTCDELPEGCRIAFVVTAASGRQVLIGTREPKYPQVNYSESLGSPGGAAAIRNYKITHVALKSVITCIL